MQWDGAPRFAESKGNERMNTMRKRLLSTALALLLCLTVLLSVPVTAQAAGGDEFAYAAAFDAMRREIRENYLIKADYYPSQDISECAYTFYDIDGNGVSELIFQSGGGTAAIYTIFQSRPVLVAQWAGGRDHFDGINAYGYMHGFGASSAFSDVTSYVRMADDGSGGTLVANIRFEYSETEQREIYILEKAGDTREISEAEAVAVKKSLTAQDLTLTGWKTLTDESGTVRPAGVFGAYREVLEQNRSEIEDYTWYGEAGLTEGSVAVHDIVGDSTPELLFIKETEGGLFVYIYGYDGEARLLLQRDEIAIAASSGAAYGVFTTTDGALYIYHSLSNDSYWQDLLERYVLDGETLVKTGTLFYSADGAESPIMTYELDGEPIGESAFNAEVADIFSRLDTMLMQSFLEYDPRWDGIERPDAVTVSLSDALDYLSGRTRVQAQATSSDVSVNGKAVAFDAYNIAGNNYFKLRDLAYVLSGTDKQFEVSWDGTKNAVGITGGRAYTAVGGELTGRGASAQTGTPTTSVVYLDGAEIYLTAYNIGGNNYFKLRDVGSALNFAVDWDGETNTVAIDTARGYTAA